MSEEALASVDDSLLDCECRLCEMYRLGVVSVALPLGLLVIVVSPIIIEAY